MRTIQRRGVVRRALLCSIALSGAAVLVACSFAGAKNRVTTRPTEFIPPRIEIAAGDSVTWEFKGEHNAVFKKTPEGYPADIPVSPIGEYTRVFAKAGTFAYDCTLHPGMKGEVVVR